MVEEKSGVPLDTATIVADRTTRYFLIKSYNNDNIGRSLQYEVWATSERNEKVLADAYRTSAYVVLIFSVNYSSRFSGFGVMTSEPGKSKYKKKPIFCASDGSPFPGKMFSVHWITNCEVFFRDCKNILNAFNDNKSVKIGRDGQEIDPHAGKALCLLIDSKQPEHSRPTPLLIEAQPAHPSEEDSSSGGILKNLAAIAKMLKTDESADKKQAVDKINTEWDFQWIEAFIKKNPIYSIFPVDLTEILDYDSYLKLYEESRQKWSKICDQLKAENHAIPKLPSVVHRFIEDKFDAEATLRWLAESHPSKEIQNYLKQFEVTLRPPNNFSSLKKNASYAGSLAYLQPVPSRRNSFGHSNSRLLPQPRSSVLRIDHSLALPPRSVMQLPRDSANQYSVANSHFPVDLPRNTETHAYKHISPEHLSRYAYLMNEPQSISASAYYHPTVASQQYPPTYSQRRPLSHDQTIAMQSSLAFPTDSEQSSFYSTNNQQISSNPSLNFHSSYFR